MSQGLRRFHVGDRLSEMTIFNGTVYLAGQVAADASQDIRGQTRQVLAAIDRLLAEAGTDNAHLLMAQIFLPDLADFAAMGTGRRSTDGASILQAAAIGKVQHLLVQRGGQMPGHAQRILGLGLGEGYAYRNADLVNAATVEVLRHKGLVWLLEPEQMPDAVVMAAVMRYADDKAGE